MAVVELQVEARVGDLEGARRRLSDTGVVRGAMGDLLDDAVRVGERSIGIYAPAGDTLGIKGAVGSYAAHTTPSGALEAAAGVGRVQRSSGSPDYPGMVHGGTGIYGPLRRAITPRTHRFMRFLGRTGLVYARSVAGQRPQPFVAEAYVDVVAFVEQRIDRMVARIIGE